ncbi:STAS domain-containing protein [Winogradskya humida]|uniref:STAS domain-containing protein n=1 Tax=Winogradskya humida TaxID=113566 RepID=UPI003F68C2A9
MLQQSQGTVAVVRVGPGGDLRALPAAASGTVRHVIVDLSSVRTVDAEGLALLVRVRQKVRQDHGGWLCLATPSRLVLTVLHTMRLERAFPTFADTPAALAWLRKDGETEAPPPLWTGLADAQQELPGRGLGERRDGDRVKGDVERFLRPA